MISYGSRGTGPFRGWVYVIDRFSIFGPFAIFRESTNFTIRARTIID